MNPDNPFRDWLRPDAYGGVWVPVAQLGGWTEAASCPALFRADSIDRVLATTDWPLHPDSARPSVGESYSDGKVSYHSELHPTEHRNGVTFLPFVAMFNPYTQSAWLEPTQAFLLHWEAWPKHHGDGNVTWFSEGDDSLPVELARWRVESYAEHVTLGRLEVRRDRLLSFLATFDFDLAIYHEEHVDSDLPGGWKDEAREPARAWRVWTAEVSRSNVRAVLRAVTVLKRPSRSEVMAPWDTEDVSGITYPIGMDPDTGREIRVTHPPHEFLTPVYFREGVLEKYYADPSLYTVEETLIRGGRHWTLSIARTNRGTLHVWLGDIARLPISPRALAWIRDGR